MIELKITINEEISKNLDEGKATCCAINIKELGKKVTEGEMQTLEIIKNRLKVHEKFQFENLSKRKSKDEMVEDLIKSLLK